MTQENLDLIINVIEELIAAVPQIVVVLTTVVYSLNAIKSKVNSFPKQIEETKTSLNTSFDETKKQISATLNETEKQLLKKVDEANKRMEQHVANTLIDMKGELLGYKEELKSNSDQTNILIRQNKIFMEIIANLVSQDQKKIEEGLAKTVIVKTTLSKKELEQYPQLLVKELPILQSAMKEVLTMIGKDEFQKLLEKVGYGEGNKKV